MGSLQKPRATTPFHLRRDTNHEIFLILGLSAGLGVSRYRYNSNASNFEDSRDPCAEAEVSSAMMGAFDDGGGGEADPAPTYSPTTYAPTASPSPPPASSLSNDFGSGGGGRVRGLRGPTMLLRGSPSREEGGRRRLGCGE